jgi:hypothetical protein
MHPVSDGVVYSISGRVPINLASEHEHRSDKPSPCRSVRSHRGTDHDVVRAEHPCQSGTEASPLEDLKAVFKRVGSVIDDDALINRALGDVICDAGIVAMHLDA